MNDMVEAAVSASRHGDNVLAAVRILRSPRYPFSAHRRAVFEKEMIDEVRTAVRFARKALETKRYGS